MDTVPWMRGKAILWIAALLLIRVTVANISFSSGVLYLFEANSPISGFILVGNWISKSGNWEFITLNFLLVVNISSKSIIRFINRTGHHVGRWIASCPCPKPCIGHPPVFEGMPVRSAVVMCGNGTLKNVYEIFFMVWWSGWGFFQKIRKMNHAPRLSFLVTRAVVDVMIFPLTYFTPRKPGLSPNCLLMTSGLNRACPWQIAPCAATPHKRCLSAGPASATLARQWGSACAASVFLALPWQQRPAQLIRPAPAMARSTERSEMKCGQAT